MSLLVTLAASSSVIPFIISVNTDDVAIALAQPNVLNFASLILPFLSSLNVSFSASPQASDPTSPTPSGFSTSPTLCGLKKWSLTLSVYSHIFLPLTQFQSILEVSYYIIDVLSANRDANIIFGYSRRELFSF